MLDGGFIGVWHMAGGRRVGTEPDLAGLAARCGPGLATGLARTDGPAFFVVIALFCGTETPQIW